MKVVDLRFRDNEALAEIFTEYAQQALTGELLGAVIITFTTDDDLGVHPVGSVDPQKVIGGLYQALTTLTLVSMGDDDE